MLAVANRLSDATSFREVTRQGRRAVSRSLVLYALVPEPHGPGGEVTCGLVVSRTVGNSVVRNRVKRRLRHLVRERLASMPSGSRIVVRALPLAAEASGAGLAADLDRCLAKVLPGAKVPTGLNGTAP